VVRIGAAGQPCGGAAEQLWLPGWAAARLHGAREPAAERLNIDMTGHRRGGAAEQLRLPG